MLQVHFFPKNNTAKLPVQQHQGDAGYDLSATTHNILYSGEFRTIKCGFSLQIPAGYAGLVCPRSGLAANYGITVLNAPGIIDSSFEGELGVILMNLGAKTFEINPGDRIAQLVFIKIESIPVESKSITRGTDGFGSSGVI